MPVSYRQAKTIATDRLLVPLTTTSPENPFSSGMEAVEYAILDSETIETEWGYVFFYQSKEYVETGKFSAMLGGNAPLVVLKETGELYETGTAEPVEHYLRELEGWLGVGSGTRRRPDIEVALSMTPTSEGGRQGAAFSGYRPSFAIREDYHTSGVIELIGVDEIAPGQTSEANITFLTPAVYPHTIWVGRVLRAQEGAKVVGTAQVTQVFNPILAVGGPLYEVILGGEVLGRSPLAGRDPGMGVATGPLVPTFAFTKVEEVFALFADSQGDTGTVDRDRLSDYYKKRDKLDLKLRSPDGSIIGTECIHIADFRSEIGPDACELEVHLSSPEFFDQDS